MKFIIILFTVSFSQIAHSAEYYYQVEQNDQLGVILLSLGHKKLWPKDGKVNQFKKSSSLPNPNKISVGDILKLSEKDILFKKNVILDKDYVSFKKKIKTLPEFEQALVDEGIDYQNISDSEPPKIEVIGSNDEQNALNYRPEVIQSFNLYPGLGFFIASDKEINGNAKTDTFIGIQPMIQLKGIYSSSLFGSLAVDLLTKKIITNKFTFPINFDYRLQFVPKWNISDTFKMALSHSVLQHSYVGSNNQKEVAQELNSNFIGLGLVIPSEKYWFELYLEKAYTTKKKSLQSTQSIGSGFRLDTEVVYSIYEKWRLIPGFNYYKVEDKSTNYSLEVVEARLVFAREFEF